jgi:hypothetical protein
MGLRSPLALMSTVGLFTLGFLAPWGATKAVADSSGDRLGCGTYCQSAGGYGAPGGYKPPPAATLISSGTVTADADGYAPVTLTCNLQVQCMGALLMGGGRSDLLVNAGATRTIAVPLSPQVFAGLKANGPTTLDLTIDTGQSGPQFCQGHAGNYSPFLCAIPDHLTVAAPG